MAIIRVKNLLIRTFIGFNADELKDKQDVVINYTIEDRLKRDRSQHKFGPRTIDLDIIVWNGTIVYDDYHTRDFVKKTADKLL